MHHCRCLASKWRRSLAAACARLMSDDTRGASCIRMVTARSILRCGHTHRSACIAQREIRMIINACIASVESGRLHVQLKPGPDLYALSREALRESMRSRFQDALATCCALMPLANTDDEPPSKALTWPCLPSQTMCSTRLVHSSTTF